MRKKIFRVAGWLLLLLMVGISIPAGAVEVLVNVDVPAGQMRDVMGFPLTVRTTSVQLINAGVDRTINPPGKDRVTTGDDVIMFDQAVGYSSATPTTSLGPGAVFFQGYVNVSHGDVIYLRAWDHSYYGNSSTTYTFNIEGSLSPTYCDTWHPSITTNRQAIAPPQPTVAPTTQVLYDEAFNPRLSVTFVPAPGTYDICPTDAGPAYVYNFYQEATGTGTRWTYSSNDPAVTITTGTPGRPDWLFSAEVHSVKTQARNWIGDSPESIPPAATYTIISAAGGQAVYNVRIQPAPDGKVRIRWQATTGVSNFSLYKVNNLASDSVDWGSPIDITATADGAYWYVDRDLSPAPTSAGEEYWRVLPRGADKNEYPRDVVGRKTYILDTSHSGLGVNSIALPFSRNWDLRTGGLVSTARELETALTNPGATNFEFLGGWNTTGQTEFSYRAGGADSFDLLPGVGYQLSLGGTTDTYSWTVIGIK
jgi:hypothetical protein